LELPLRMSLGSDTHCCNDDYDDVQMNVPIWQGPEIKAHIKNIALSRIPHLNYA